MEIRTRTDIGIGLLFRYLLVRYRAALWFIWVGIPVVAVIGSFDSLREEDPVEFAVFVIVAVVFGGLVAHVVCPLFAFLQAMAAAYAGGRQWEYVIDADGIEVSGEAVQYRFKWDELRKVRKHGIGWRLWFGRGGMQVLLPRKALDDQQAAMFESWSGYVLRQTQGAAPGSVTVEQGHSGERVLG